jgi:phospholipase C
VTDQTSIIRFIEDNWQTGRIGDYSFDALAGDLQPMFDFSRKKPAVRLILNPNTGQIVDSQD